MKTMVARHPIDLLPVHLRAAVDEFVDHSAVYAKVVVTAGISSVMKSVVLSNFAEWARQYGPF